MNENMKYGLFFAKVETVKENMDDMVAEARHAAEQRREAKEEA